MTRTLLLIFAFIALMVGSFIWFVATWDRDSEEPISRATPLLLLTPKTPPGGSLASNPNFFHEIESLRQNRSKAATSDPYQDRTRPTPNPYGVL